MPRPRLTLRWLLAATAASAALTFYQAPELTRRWRACQAAAARRDGCAEMCKGAAESSERLGMSTSAAFARQKEAIHREAARRNRWAFFDPFRPCVLNDDVY